MDRQTRETDGHAPFEGDSRLERLHRVRLMMLKDFAAICEKEVLVWFGA